MAPFDYLTAAEIALYGYLRNEEYCRAIAAERLCTARSGGGSGGGGRPRRTVRHGFSKAAMEYRARDQAEKNASRLLRIAERQAQLRNASQRQREAARRELSRLRSVSRYTEQGRRSAEDERLQRGLEPTRPRVSPIERLRQKLMRQFPAAAEVYNNPFNRINHMDADMANLLNSLSSDQIKYLITDPNKDEINPGSVFNRKLIEMGYEPPIFYYSNPRWYHESPSNYGVR
jgi:hypothetical protein